MSAKFSAWRGLWAGRASSPPESTQNDLMNDESRGNSGRFAILEGAHSLFKGRERFSAWTFGLTKPGTRGRILN